MRTINDGKGITLHLSFEEAATITEALRRLSQSLADANAEQARAMVDAMTNKQEVRI